jgi:tetratricopeptide (TPR) repeat protein
MALYQRRTWALAKKFAPVLIWFIGIAISYTPGYCTGTSTDTAANPSVLEKQDLVQQAVAHYEQGEMKKAAEGLEKSKAVFPENYAVPYYLGLIYLEQGNVRGAIAEWKQYVRMDPKSENSLNVRKHLTLLLREQAREFAKRAVSTEAALAAGPTPGKTIAVSSFINLGSEDIGPLGKGMAAMLISDLSQVPDLQVVDRMKLHALLEEMELGASGLVDTKTAPRVGRLLKAKHVTSGSLADLEKERLMMASAVVDTDRKDSIGTQQAKGELKEFYEIEKQIACQIIEDLGKDCDSAPEGFSKTHTKSLPALVSYSWGLTYFDEENYDQAREMFQKALEEDPKFDLAEAMLMATPTMAMVAMGTSEVIASVSSSGPSSAASGAATVGTSTAGTTATAGSIAASTMGLPPMATVAGGAVLIGGGVALAGGGGGGGGGNGPTPADQADLNGDWTGSWIGSGGDAGQATFSLTQTGDAVTGTVSVTGGDCLSRGDVTGNVSGNRANLSIQSGAETVAIDATADNSADTLTGTWSYSSSALGCADDTGNFSVDLTTGGADVRW